MPYEILLNFNWFSWYNSSIDVYSLSVTIIELLIKYLKNDIYIDHGLLYILDVGLMDNDCYYSFGIT